jgi:hypothetical protein
MDDPALVDLEYRAEFERQQFALYDTRRLSAETHANAVIAAAIAVAAFVLADYGRQPHAHLVWLLVALLGITWAIAMASLARVVSWTTPRWRGGAKLAPSERLPSNIVGQTLSAVRGLNDADRNALRERIVEHWRARAESAWRLGQLKDRRLGLSLWGFAGPLAYFAARLAL